MLGRLVHYTADALLFSTLLAGVKRSSGLSPDLDRITNESARNIAEKYIGLGEFVFDSSMAAAHASQYFKKANANSNAPIPSPLANLASKAEQQQQQFQQGGAGGGSWWK